MTRRTHRWKPAILASLLLLGLTAGAPPARAGDYKSHPGYVDGQAFIELAGDDQVMVELSLPGPILRALARIDPELYELVGGLESIHAVILELDSPAKNTKLVEAVRATERKLMRSGWSRLARVRDEEGEYRVLLLTRDEIVEGLVVMGMDRNDGSMFFANIAGAIDLERISRIGEEFDIPGLDDLRDP